MSVPRIDELLLVDRGFALHWLKPRSKAPVDDGWSTAPVANLHDLYDSYQPDYNLGVRPDAFSLINGLYLHLIDLDIRDESTTAEALAKLHELCPEIDTFPFVISGSGGSSRHFYFVTDQPFRSKKLAHSTDFTMVFDKAKDRDVKKWHWEIELFGTGKQAAMPPSIHPTTGKPYVWGRPFDFEALDMGFNPYVSAARVTEWSPHLVENNLPRETIGMSAKEAQNYLKDLPLDAWCVDRDGWYKVGMALHHEFGGTDEAFKLWDDFSKQEPTKYDAKNQKSTWTSFGRYTGRPVRMATLIDATKMARLARVDDDFDEEDPEIDDDEDLLGVAPTADDPDDLLGTVPGTPPDEDNRDWEQLFDWSDGEKPALKPTPHNLELIFLNDPRIKGVIGFNQLLQSVVYIGKPGVLRRGRKGIKPKKQLKGAIWHLDDPINGDLWSDEKDIVIRNILSSPKSQGGWNLKVAKMDVRDTVAQVARSNSFHPVQEFLKTLTWDGVPRLELMFIKWLGAEDTLYHREIAKLMLLGAVTRSFEPGHKFDYVAILEGVQGKGKSSWIETLAKSWFAELNGDFSDRKAMVEQMMGHVIIELPELAAFNKADILTMKGFVSAPADTVRLPYAHHAGTYKRSCIFFGSTNDDEYLKDATGGRRFWPVYCHIDTIDIEGFAKEVDQLWAEAYAIYLQMRIDRPFGRLPLYLRNSAAVEEALAKQESRRVETAEESMAGKLGLWMNNAFYGDFDDPMDVGDEPQFHNEVCLRQLWVECLGNDERTYDQRAAQSLGKAIKLVPGWYNADRHETKKYGQQRVYRRIGWDGIDE